MEKIQLSQGLFALVDDVDFERANAFKWCSLKIGKQTYAVRNSSLRDGPPKTILLHRFIADAEDGILVDHKNGNGLDCQRSNLRLCTQTQNLMNRGPNVNNKSGYKGVSWDNSRKKWIASINNKHLGRFENALDAAHAYDAKAVELFGQFAKTNF